MAGTLRIKNWEKFQHYKDRDPEWIKLHVKLMQSEDWVLADDAGKLLMLVCLMIGAKKKGFVPNSPDYIKRVGQLRRKPNLKPLIDCGFLEIVQADASNAEQTAILEKRREEKEDVADSAAKNVARETSHVAVGETVLEIMGVKNDPRFAFSYQIVGGWLAAGYDPEADIYPTVRAVMAKRDGQGPPGSLKYFTEPIGSAHRDRTTPASPKLGPHYAKRTNHNGPGITDIARELIDPVPDQATVQ